MRALLCAAAFLLLAIIPSVAAEEAPETGPQPCAGYLSSGAQTEVDLQYGVYVEVGVAGRGVYAGYSSRCQA